MRNELYNGNGNGVAAYVQADTFSVRETIQKYTRRKWLFILSIIICVSLAMAYIWVKTPLYNIYATLVIKDQKKGEVTNIALKELDFFDEQKIVDNEAEIIRSENIIRSVVNRMHLNIGYFEDGPFIKAYPRYYTSPVKLEVLSQAIRDKISFEV